MMRAKCSCEWEFSEQTESQSHRDFEYFVANVAVSAIFFYVIFVSATPERCWVGDKLELTVTDMHRKSGSRFHSFGLLWRLCCGIENVVVLAWLSSTGCVCYVMCEFAHAAVAGNLGPNDNKKANSPIDYNEINCRCCHTAVFRSPQGNKRKKPRRALLML